MEEYDDLVPTPDEDGKLELTYRGWKLVDEVIWTMGRELVILNLSFNSLEELAPELGDLRLIRQLDVSCNKLVTFPKQIGKLSMLKVLKCNGNRIQSFPDEIGDCQRLQKILAGENSLLELPHSFHKLKDLSTLQVCNNSLTKLPPALCLLPNLKDIDIGNNPGLEFMIPLKLQDNTHFILWMCRVVYEHETQLALIEKTNQGYHAMMRKCELATNDIIEKVEKVNDDYRDLRDEIPVGCDGRRARCYACCFCRLCCKCRDGKINGCTLM